ncbi:MAG: hypothetical protein ACREDZ_15085 [Kiloniellales bacterium]
MSRADLFAPLARLEARLREAQRSSRLEEHARQLRPASPLSTQQRTWLARGLKQPGGKLPLFDVQGQRVNPRTVESCLTHGWAERWFDNPMKPEWQVCRLTAAGRAVLAEAAEVESAPDSLLLA